MLHGTLYVTERYQGLSFDVPVTMFVSLTLKMSVILYSGYKHSAVTYPAWLSSFWWKCTVPVVLVFQSMCVHKAQKLF